ncbi:MAG: hypothetical protein J6Y08_05530 [Clostridiales bacterium]|nr:hypothetical protein [Clostridiales bacterium]
MATLCNHCGTPLVFHPRTQRVVCTKCNSNWIPEEVSATICNRCGEPLVFDPLKKVYKCGACGASWQPSEAIDPVKERLETVKVMPEGASDEIVEEFINCYVYVCSSCGGSVIVNDSEASTTCVYCGSPTVVFERIAKEKAPEFIIPFSVSEEEAVDAVHGAFQKNQFIPKAFKNATPEIVRGIYVPYWIVDGLHAEAAIVEGFDDDGNDSASFQYFGRSGLLEFHNLTQDASLMLNDAIAEKLEPFDLNKLRIFHESYLLGFYSNVSDMKNYDLVKAVSKRTETLFEEDMMSSIRVPKLKLRRKFSNTLVNKDVRYAMMPVWFVSFNYNGEHHTALVNGDTGKVVSAIPWKKGKFVAELIALGLAITALLAVPGYFFLSLIELSRVQIIFTGFLCALPFLIVGIVKMRKITKKIKSSLEASASIFHFAKNRQE